MSTDLRQKAIEHTVLKHNLFATCPQLEIRNKRFGRSLGHRILESSMVQVGLRMLEFGSEKSLKVAAIIAGLILGWGLALFFSSIFLAVAWYILRPDFSQSILDLLLKQSWWNYLGYTLTGATIFALPYLHLGFPIYISLRLHRSIDHAFARRRWLRDIQHNNDNNDPMLLKMQIETYHYTGERHRFSQIIERIVSSLGALIGFLTGGIIGFLPLIIYLRLVLFLLNFGVWVLLFAVVATGGWGLILGLLALVWFFRSFLAGGMAFRYFIRQLFANKPYLVAWGAAGVTFIEQTFKIED